MTLIELAATITRTNFKALLPKLGTYSRVEQLLLCKMASQRDVSLFDNQLFTKWYYSILSEETYAKALELEKEIGYMDPGKHIIPRPITKYIIVTHIKGDFRAKHIDTTTNSVKEAKKQLRKLKKDIRSGAAYTPEWDATLYVKFETEPKK